MMLLCKCGKVKSASPHRSAATKPWLCDDCSGRNKPKARPSTVLKRVRTLDLLKRRAT
jgi:hypothetical protein